MSRVSSPSDYDASSPPEGGPAKAEGLYDLCWTGPTGDPTGEPIFFAASHQTGLRKRSMTRRSIKVGIRGVESWPCAEARVLVTMMHPAHLKMAQP